ncbi:MAG: hypothetical protein BAJATHORv1_30165 [Candidatus Thorarchaeota archaeon]|nr:MAG: hypothetical protein BAJATHORv1_30165 [Candidatus Thorarchaeota archaeon]
MADDKKKSSDERFDADDTDSVVGKLLADLGVDEEMKQELVDSGRLKGDVFRVESADQVRRRIEIEKSSDKLRETLHLVERALISTEETVDGIERDIIPVVLSFLVGLKGKLVNLRNSVIQKGKRQAKTALQANYVENQIREIMETEFSEIEESLTSGMSTPVLQKVRDVAEDLKKDVRSTYDDLSNLKANFDDYMQKTATEMEFLVKALSMKPRVEVPKEVEEDMKNLQRRVEELERDLQLSEQKVENRETDIQRLRVDLSTSKLRIDALEDQLAQAQSTPSDVVDVSELRMKITSIEASRDLLSQKVNDAESRVEAAKEEVRHAKSQLTEKDLQIDEAKAKIRQLEQEIEQSSDVKSELDELKTKIRTLESGDTIRELDRTKTELDRAQANLERMSKEYVEMRHDLDNTIARIESYMALMQNTEKTKAFLMVEDTGQLSVREVARSVGVSPAVVMDWAGDYERLGIAKLIDETTLVATIGKKKEGIE